MTLPLADYCSLCDAGYAPTLSIDISDDPCAGEYRWAHEQCLRDHGRVVAEMADTEAGE